MSISRLWRVATALVIAFMAFIPSTPAEQARVMAARITEAVDESQLVTLRGNTHPLARPEFDQGAAPDTLPMERMLLVLQRAPEQEKALEKLLDEQQVKGSPQYHQWLTPEQFGREFGPADSDIQTITNWLTAEGFGVNHVSAGRVVIEFSGTAGQVRQALHTEIHQYMVNGEAHWANASDPQIPAALAPVVAGVATLNNFRRHSFAHLLGTFSRSKATGEVTPLFTFPQGSGNFFAVGPTDFATIYNVAPLWAAGIDGTGQTIAIVGDTDINLQDVRDFRSMFGLPAKDPVVIVNGPDPGTLSSADESEADLDVEWSGAVAINATIDFVISAGTDSTVAQDLSALYIVDNNLAPVMSYSFGSCEKALGVTASAFYSALWQQAAAQGITAVVAAGDSGSATCDGGVSENAANQGLTVSGIASTPFNVAVGGTDFDDVGRQATFWNSSNTSPARSSALSYIPEATWNDSCAAAGATTGCPSPRGGQDLAAGGGGPSTCGVLTGVDPTATCVRGYAKPTWQTGIGVPTDGVRDLPDVSLFSGNGKNGSADVICQSDVNPGKSSCNLSTPFTDFQAVGGTSAAAPAFAGIMAMVNQKTGARQGNANYVLYRLAALAGASCNSSTVVPGPNACLFYDITRGNNSVACQGGSPNCSTPTTSQFGIMVTGAGSTTPAWTTNLGYDLATGLGSVNAANLANNWNSVTFFPTTTTLSVSPSPTTVAHGATVNLNISVTSGAGTPTGVVSLLGPSSAPMSGLGDFPLTVGAFSGTTNSLPGGTYNVTAHYAGDGNFGASDSAPVSVTVTKEGSTTKPGLVTFDFTTGAITSNNAPTAPYGSPYVFHVDVTNASGSLCAPNETPVYGCPTGTVTLTNNGAPLDAGTFPLNSMGNAEDAAIQLPAGLHSIVASYGGDASYNSSAAAPDAITISTATTTTTVSAPSTAIIGASITLTATVSTQSNGVAPTGAVQFFNGGTLIGSATSSVGTPGPAVSASLTATLSTTFSANATITAQYAGDPNYAGSTSAAAPITVTAAPPDFTITASPTSFNITSPGQSNTATMNVTYTGGLTGTVSLICLVPASMTEAACSVNPTSLTASGTSTLTVTTTAPHTVGSVFKGPNGLWSGGALLASLLLLCLLAVRRQFKPAIAMAVLTLLAAGFIACGGGGGGGGPTNDPGTPAGTYSVTVTGTNGGTMHSATVSVTVL